MANYSEITNIELETMTVEMEAMGYEEAIKKKLAENEAVMAAYQVLEVIYSYKDYCMAILDYLDSATTTVIDDFSMTKQLLPIAEYRLKAVGFHYSAFNFKVTKQVIPR